MPGVIAVTRLPDLPDVDSAIPRLVGVLLPRPNKESGIDAIRQALMAFFQVPTFTILLRGILWRRATGRAALIALLSGIATSVSLYALNQPAVYESLGWPPLFQIQEPFLYFSIWAFLVTATLLIVISLQSNPDPDEKLQYVYSARSITESPTTPPQAPR